MLFLREYLLHNTDFKSQLLTFFFRCLFIGKIFLLFNHYLKLSTLLWRNLSGVFFYGHKSLASEKQFLSKNIHLSAVTTRSPVACIFLSVLHSQIILSRWGEIQRNLLLLFSLYLWCRSVFPECIVPQALCYSESEVFFTGLTVSDLFE